MRPFDFMVPFWGRRYRGYFVVLCLPSLLAPNNLSLLNAADGHRFLIATTEEDWKAIWDLPIMGMLQRHAEPVWIEIEPPSERDSPNERDRYEATIRQQNEAQKALVMAAGTRRMYGSMTFPDVIYSDGMVATLLRLARDGYRAAILPAMRQIEETTISDLTSRGYLRAGEKLSITARPLCIPQRVAADLAVRHLHPEMDIFDQRRLTQNWVIPFRFWRIDSGLLLHSFYGCLPFIDYAALPQEHAKCLDKGVFENVYASVNLAGLDPVHIMADSDEFIILSLTPRATNWAQPVSSRWQLFGYERLVNIRKSMQFYAGDDRVRRDLFLSPVRWHSRDIGWRWRRKERWIALMLWLAIGDYMGGRFPERPHWIDQIETFVAMMRLYWHDAGRGLRRVSLHSYHGVLYLTQGARRAAYRLATLARGDAAARK
jgi:hypothetical protein